MPTPDDGSGDQPQAEAPWPYDPVAFAAQTEGIERGIGFPLASGAVPTLHELGVQWIADIERIDVTVALDGQRRPTATALDELADFGEFCLRYGTRLLRLAVPEEEWPRIRLLTLIYRRTDENAPILATDLGFGFLALGGRCTLEPPYPAGLVSRALRQARRPLATATRVN